MGDLLRIVTLSGGRPVEVLNLDQVDETTRNYVRLKDTFKFTPATGAQQTSESGRRWGGARIVGETHGNASISWQALVSATTYDEAAVRIEALLEAIDYAARARTGRRIEWRADGLDPAHSSLFEIMGPGTWDPGYKWAEWHGGTAMPVTVTFPVAPLPEWVSMTIRDDFATFDKVGGRTNLCANARGKTSTTNWTNVSLVSFNVTGSPPAGLPDELQPDSAIFISTNANDDRATHNLAVTSGVTYTVSMYVNIDTLSASNLRFQVRRGAGGGGAIITAPSGGSDLTVLDTWRRLSITFAATATETYTVEIVQIGAGAMDAFFTGGLFEVGSTLNAFADGESPKFRFTGIPFQSSSVELDDEKTIGDYAEDGIGFVGQSGDHALTPGSTLSNECEYRHTARGYDYSGGQATIRSTPGTTITGYKSAVRLRYTNASNYLEAYLDDNGTNTRVRLDKVIAGVRTNLQSVNAGARITAGMTIAVRGRLEGRVAFVEYSGYKIYPMDSFLASTTPNLLTDAELAALPSGDVGWSWIPQTQTARIQDFEYQPYVFRDATLPEDSLKLLGVPGTAPALANVTLTTLAGGGVQPSFGMFGWAPEPLPYNRVWNGDFEYNSTGTSGWAIGIVTGVVAAAATSIALTTPAAPKFGVQAGQVVTPATSDSGVNFHLYGRFKRGRSYVLRVWLAAPSSVTQMNVKLGVNGDISTTTHTLTTTFTEKVVTWIPTADRNECYVAISTNAATATTFHIDGVSVTEGSAVLMLPGHAEGHGGIAPFGVIEAESCFLLDLAGWAIASSGSARSGQQITRTVTGAESLVAAWVIDSGTLAPDDFTEAEIDLEIWGRFLLSTTLVTPTVITSIRPFETGLGTTRYTHEWGSAGKPMAIANASAIYRPYRLGTITVPADAVCSVPMKLFVNATTGIGSTGSFGLDYLWIVPLRARALSPTGRILNTAYPKWITTANQVSKTIYNDLSGAIMPARDVRPHPDHGLGGSLLEFPPGDVALFVKLSDVVPDDPTGASVDEALSFQGTVAIDLTPRSRLMRSA